MKNSASPTDSPLAIHARVTDVITSHNLFKANSSVIVGVSGGPDSLALLHILHAIKIRLDLTAVYVNHGLRPKEIEDEEKTIAAHCKKLAVPFVSQTVDVLGYLGEKKCSLEEAARILRYKALEEIRKKSKAAVITVAHTSDDQVEEFFIRLIRGSGLKGLSGIQLKRDLIVRPLLKESKANLVQYLSDAGIIFCQDSSNFDRKFLRNRVRLDLLPKLENEFNPSIRKTIVQNMDILAGDEDFISNTGNKAFAECTSDRIEKERQPTSPQLTLSLTKLNKYHLAIQRRIIEKCFWHMGIKPSYSQIGSLISFAKSADNNREMHLTDGVRAEKLKGRIIFNRPLSEGQLRGSSPALSFDNQTISSPGTYPIAQLNQTLILSIEQKSTDTNSAGAGAAEKGTLKVDMENICFPLLLRPPIPGERFKPYGAPGKKKILRYLAEKKIEVKKRRGYPVLIAENRVIALPGLQIAHEFRTGASTKEVLKIELVQN